LELKNYLDILLRRKWVIAIMVLVTMLVVVVGTFKMSPTYTAIATLRIATASASTTGSDYMFADRLITTYINIATSKPMINELKTRLNLALDPEITVKQIASSELIQISADDQDPSLAMQIANTLGDILISKSGEFYTSSGKTPADILKEQVDEAEADLNHLRTDYYNHLALFPNDTTGNQRSLEAVDSQQQLYFSLLSQYQQMRVKEAIQSNLISFVERAELPEFPSKPNKLLNLVLGFTASLICGIGLAFLFENLDTTINTSEDLSKITDARSIGWIPFAQRDVRKRPLLEGDSSYNEAFFRLRTNLLMMISHPPIRTIMVASALQGEGKTMVATHLALAFSQIGKRVILVDCDMRIPSVHKVFDFPNNSGLGEYLEGNASLEETIHETGYVDLRVIEGGHCHGEPGLLLDSAQMKNLVAQLFDYDLVIFDSPAVQALTDASEVAQLVDGVLMVVKLGLVHKENLEAALAQISLDWLLTAPRQRIIIITTNANPSN
jgi:capsular exopolysaccharide synthesis family protein